MGYVSNVPVSTGANYLFDTPQKFRARAYLRPAVYGTFQWRFTFSNTVDSTFADGSVAHRGKPGGSWHILSATLSLAPDRGGCTGVDAKNVLTSAIPRTMTTPVTFEGKTERAVAPGECFTSDPMEFTVPEGYYLIWEWELEGAGIPFTPDSMVPTFLDRGDGFYFTTDCPFPALFGCDRPVKKVLGLLGDSITQGCATEINGYEMWAAKVSAALSPEVAVWNLGLGYARGSDAASFGGNNVWLNRARECDVVALCFGVNDIETGAYLRGRGDTAEEFLETEEILIHALRETGVEVILGTIPPFPLSETALGEWRKINDAIPKLAEKYGLRLFDIERALDADPHRGNIFTYGAHPNGDGGTAAAAEFVRMWRDAGV